jgi:hypothetical protein
MYPYIVLITMDQFPVDLSDIYVNYERLPIYLHSHAFIIFSQSGAAHPII